MSCQDRAVGEQVMGLIYPIEGFENGKSRSEESISLTACINHLNDTVTPSIGENAGYVPLDQAEQQETMKYPQNTHEKWSFAESRFPIMEAPLGVMPEALGMSLMQLAQSHATGINAIIGIALAVIASLLGSTVLVSAKVSWTEFLIFWFADIRPSGDGKTPILKALCRVLFGKQMAADVEYENQLELFKQGKRSDKPKKPRSYFITDTTIPGLRNNISGHGGVLCLIDELATFLNPNRGYDREAWLSFFDGGIARVVRARDIKSIKASVSIAGGVQPEIWKQCLTDRNGVNINGGTLYRLLPTLEDEQFIPLTGCAWEADQQAVWEELINRIMSWSDKVISNDNWSPVNLSIDDEARALFLFWANNLRSIKNCLPDIIQSFIPKNIAYALRFTGILFCIRRFAEADELNETVLTKDDLLKGIGLAEFYMGNVIQACKLLKDSDAYDVTISRQTIALARCLESLKTKLDNGRLAIGLIFEEFNNHCHEALRLASPKAMGQLLRFNKLSVSTGKARVNGKTGVRYLKWDSSTEDFIAKALKPVEDMQKAEIDHVDEEICNLNPSDTEHLADFADIRKPAPSTVDAVISSSRGHDGHEGHRDAQISDLAQVAQV
jgi:hypothetical protein